MICYYLNVQFQGQRVKVENLLNKYRQTVNSQDSLEAEINMYFRIQTLIMVF